MLGELLALEVLLHQLVVSLGNQVAELLAVLDGAGHVFCGDVDELLLAALTHAGLHADDVDDAAEVLAVTHGGGDGHDARAEARMQLGHGQREVGALAVDVVDEDRAGETHGLGLAPQAAGHRLRAVDGVDHEEGHLGGLHGGKGVADEVRVAGSVEHVDLEVFVRDGSDRGGDGEATLDLFLIVV